MKVLCLYNNECAVELFDWLKKEGHECVLVNSIITRDWCLQESFDLAVSYTYSYIVKQDIIDALNGNIVNLHNSFLPWNRGSDPNMWSIVEGTPRGVSLHYITAGLDKGDIIAQELDLLDSNDTLATSYERLNILSIELFKKAFFYYEFWNQMARKQIGEGTYHNDKQGMLLRQCISSYDMDALKFKKKYINSNFDNKLR